VNTSGQIEKRTPARVVALFRDRLAYHYLGNWIDRSANTNIEQELLCTYALLSISGWRASARIRSGTMTGRTPVWSAVVPDESRRCASGGLTVSA